MAWVIIVIAGMFEVLFAFAMKQSAGFTKLWPSVISAVAVLISMGLLSLAMRTLPLGTAYAVWTGIGAVGTFVVGVIVLGEAATPLRIVAACLILTGLILMKFATAPGAA